MSSPFLGECLGTMTMIVLGDGVVAGVLLKHSKAEGAGWLAITAAWGIAVMCGVFVATATGSPDAHLNPAITLASVVMGGPVDKLWVYVPAQLIGGFLGAIVVWLHYLPHWRVTEDSALKLGVFCTSPAIRDIKANWLTEIIGAFFLVLIVSAIGSKAVGTPAAIQPGLAPYLVGMLVWGIGLSLGGTTGYAINPARDFGPRLAHALLPIPGKGGSDWGYAAVPILAPLVGAVAAGVFVHAIGI